MRTPERYDTVLVFEKTILVPFFYDNNNIIIMGAYLKFWYAYPEIRAPLRLRRIHLHSISPNMVDEIKPRLLIF